MTGDATLQVAGYLQQLARLRTSVAESSPEPERPLVAIWKRVRARQMEKSGVLPNGMAYSVHGSGCLFTWDDNRELDVDFLPDGSEIFDWWRIQSYSRSRGIDAVARDEELTAECRRLVALGQLVELRNGWFSPA